MGCSWQMFFCLLDERRPSSPGHEQRTRGSHHAWLTLGLARGQNHGDQFRLLGGSSHRSGSAPGVSLGSGSGLGARWPGLGAREPGRPRSLGWALGEGRGGGRGAGSGSRGGGFSGAAAPQKGRGCSARPRCPSGAAGTRADGHARRRRSAMRAPRHLARPGAGGSPRDPRRQPARPCRSLRSGPTRQPPPPPLCLLLLLLLLPL